MPERLEPILVAAGAPGSRHLSEEAASLIAGALAPWGGATERWLAAGEAWEATLAAGVATNTNGAETGAHLAAISAAVRDALGARPIDVNLIAHGEKRRKALLVADMESTMIVEECLDELADYAGVRDRVGAITERAMKGELAFEDALRERVAILKGLDARLLDEVADRITLMPGAATLIATMNANGARCALVSGGLAYFAERVASRLGFATHQANSVEIADGKLTGRAIEPILGREAKLAALERLAAAQGIGLNDAAAVGDGANDLAMIRKAGLGVAFRAKPGLVAEAQSLANGAVITHGDLTSLLYLQGYRRDEFAA